MTNEMYNELIRLYEARKKYWLKMGDFSTAYAYESAIDMLKYAYTNDSIGLAQYDCYE